MTLVECNKKCLADEKKMFAWTATGACSTYDTDKCDNWSSGTQDYYLPAKVIKSFTK